MFCWWCLTGVGYNKCICKVHVQVLYSLTCQKKMTALLGGKAKF